MLIAASALLSGCVSAVQVSGVADSVQKPSNVALFVSVTREGRAATGLSAKDFQIYEDAVLIEPQQSKLTLLPRDIAVVHRTLLLVDMGGQLSANDKQTLAKNTASFVRRVRKYQPVSVFAYDGSADIKRIANFPVGQTANEPAELEALAQLTEYEAGDPSSSLNGAVLKALEQIDSLLMGAKKPLRLGTLVTLMRQPDLAGRVSSEQLWEALNQSDHNLMALTIGEAATETASDSGLDRSGAVSAASVSASAKAFEQIAERVEELHNQYYLISYCSPARQGQREVTLEVTLHDDKGEPAVGSYSTEFDATGFSAGCDPNATPRFVVQGQPRTAGQPRKAGAAKAPAKPAGTAQTPGPPAPAAGQPEPPAEESEDIVPPPDRPGYE